MGLSTSCVCTRVCASASQFQETVIDLAESFPAGQYRRITLDLIAACIVFGIATFTFKQIDASAPRTADNVKYGEFDKDIHNVSMMEDVKAWLLNEDAVRTEWDVLQRIRQQHQA